MHKKRDIEEEVLESLSPRFSELTTFQASVSLLLILLCYPEPKSGFLNLFSQGIGLLLFSSLFFLFVMVGIGLSIWHVFIHRNKAKLEKTILGIYAILISGLAGLFATLDLLPDLGSILWIFPILNYIWWGFLVNGLNEPHKAITDDDATMIDVVISLIIIFITFLIAYYFLNLSWAVTLSMCMSVSSILLLLLKWITYSIKK